MKCNIYFPSREVALYFRASLFREAALTAEINGTTAIVNFQSRREFHRIREVASMYGR